MMATSWRSITRRRAIRIWMAKLLLLGTRIKAYRFPDSDDTGMKKFWKLKIGITNLFRSVLTGAGESWEESCGGRDWRPELRSPIVKEKILTTFKQYPAISASLPHALRN